MNPVSVLRGCLKKITLLAPKPNDFNRDRWPGVSAILLLTPGFGKCLR